MENLKVGDTVKWVSASGKLEGKILDISLAKNAAGDLVPWIIIQNQNDYRTRLCGTVNALKMMKVQKISKDVYFNIEAAKN